MHLACTSTRVSSGGSWQDTTIRDIHTPQVPPGSPSSLKPGTACGAWICFDASPYCAAQPLGPGGPGCVHAAHHRLWHWRPAHRRSSGLPHVPSSNFRTCTARSNQYRSRPLVQISPMARKPANSGGRGNQIGALCPSVPPFRGTTDRNHPAQMPGPCPFLEFGRPSPKTRRVPTQLPWNPCAPLPRRSTTTELCGESFIFDRKPGRRSLGKPLQWVFQDSGRRLTGNSAPTGS